MNRITTQFSLVFLFITLIFSVANSQEIEIIQEEAPMNNQLKVGAAYARLGLGDLEAIKGFAQYNRRISKRFELSISTGVVHGSRGGSLFPNDPDERYSIITSINDAPFGGGSLETSNSLSPHLQRTTLFTGDVNVHVVFEFNRSVIKIGAGATPVYGDVTFITEQRGISFGTNPTSLVELEELTLLIPEYVRYSNLGWNVQLNYEYHFKNRFFTNLQVAYHEWAEDNMTSLGFGFGVKF